MANRSANSDVQGFSFALGGLAGNNAQGAGFLAAALDAEMIPAMISCTSGQIYWTYLYLTALKKERRGEFLEQKMDDFLAETAPFASSDANLWRMAMVGKPGMMRLAGTEWMTEVVRNGVAAAGKIAAEWPRGFVLKAMSEIWPERTAICEFPESFFDDVADAFNDAAARDIAIGFNAYHPKDGREVVHMNRKAFDLHDKRPGAASEHRSRTVYEEITPGSVRDGLWIYQYGLAGREGFDGCYFRQTMLSEAAVTPTIFACRPINHHWLGELPNSYVEGEDLKTEVFMNGAYQGERDKIKLVNKLLEKQALDPSQYHPISLVEVEIEVQRGYFDYIFEDKSIFDRARGETLKKFRVYRGEQKPLPFGALAAPLRAEAITAA